MSTKIVDRKLKKGEFTREQLVQELKTQYGKKITGAEFTTNDISQYILRGYIPYRYGGKKIISKKVLNMTVIKYVD